MSKKDNDLIFDLNAENLKRFNLDSEAIQEFMNCTRNYILQCNSGNFFLDKNQNKVYTGKEFYRKTYFENGSLYFPIKYPDLIPEYFDLAFSEYLRKQKFLLASIFDEKECFYNFIEKETKRTLNTIKTIELEIEKYKNVRFYHKENNLTVYKAYISFLSNKLKSNQSGIIENKYPKPEDKYKTNLWFKIGLLFANGEMDNLLKRFNDNATQIAEELGNTSYRPYISDSIGVNKKSDKNIFNSRDKMSKIIKHCEDNHIEVKQTFSDLLPME